MQIIEHLLILVGSCLLNLFLYLFFHWFLTQFNTRYPTLNYDRKCYVVKNLTKSFLLAMFGIFFTPVLYRYLKYHQFSDWELTAYGCLYTSTDLTGLLVVPNLPMTTKIHHTVVTLLGFTTIFLVDFHKFGLSHAFIPLTYLSVIPYLVNTLLAFRFIAYPLVNRWLARLSLIIYALSIALNFGFQHYFVFWLLPSFSPNQSIDWTHWFYLIVVYYLAILRDDLKLLSYLYNKSLQPLPTQSEESLLTPLPCEINFDHEHDE